MNPDTPASPAVSKAAFWTGWTLSVLPSLLLLMSGVMKFVKPPGTAEGFAKLGIPLSHSLGLGILEISCTLLYLIPRTSVLGAILVTGYLGGAIQTNVRVGEAFWPLVLVGIAVWGGLYLRETRLRALIPLRR
jgi:hypothetical protein